MRGGYDRQGPDDRERKGKRRGRERADRQDLAGSERERGRGRGAPRLGMGQELGRRARGVRKGGSGLGRRGPRREGRKGRAG